MEHHHANEVTSYKRNFVFITCYGVVSLPSILIELLTVLSKMQLCYWPIRVTCYVLSKPDRQMHKMCLRGYTSLCVISKTHRNRCLSITITRDVYSWVIRSLHSENNNNIKTKRLLFPRRQCVIGKIGQDLDSANWNRTYCIKEMQLIAPRIKKGIERSVSLNRNIKGCPQYGKNFIESSM